MLSFIETTHFKKLDCFRAEFTEGTNLVLGPNGFGKTTLFNALRFALYGTQAIASSSENIPTWGQKTCQVKIALAGKFLVVRSLKDCKIYIPNGEGALVEDPAFKVAEGSTPCTKWVKEFLGIDHKMFSVFNMSMQGETGALITLGAAELNRIVESFSGVGILDTVIKSVSKESTQLEGALGTVQYIQPDEYVKSLEELTGKLGKAKSAVTFEKETLKECEGKLEKLQTTYNEGIEHNQKIEKALRHVASLQAKIGARQEAIDAANETLDLIAKETQDVDPDKLRSLADEHKKNLEAFSKDSALHSTYEVNQTHLRDDLGTYTENAKIEARCAEERLQVNTLIDLANGASTLASENLVEVASAYKAIKKSLDSGVCGECKRPHENFDRAGVEKDLQAAEKLMQKAKKTKQKALDEVEMLREKLAAIPDVGTGNEGFAEKSEKELAAVTEKIKALETRWEHFEEDDVTAELSDLNAELNQYDNLIEREVSARNSRAQHVEALNLTKSELEKVKHSLSEKQDLSSYKVGIDSAIAQLSQQREDVSIMENIAHEAQTKVTMAESELKKIQGDNSLHSKFSADIDKAKRLMKFLRDSRTKYMTGVWSLILGAASDWVNKTTHGWITAVGRNDKGEFTFTENGIVAPAHSEASGAQKEFIGTALRIGLSQSFQGGDSLLLLDEPTAGMREDNADKLASGLLNVSGQKIIITHRESERLTAGNVINVGG